MSKNTNTHPNNAYVVSVQLDFITYSLLRDIKVFSGESMSETLKRIIEKATWAYQSQLCEQKKKAAKNVLYDSRVLLDKEYFDMLLDDK